MFMSDWRYLHTSSRNRAEAGMCVDQQRLGHHTGQHRLERHKDSRKEHADMGTDRQLVPGTQFAARVYPK